MSVINLRVIPKPAEGTRTVFVTTVSISDDIAIFGGKGEHDYVCGYCGRIICKSTNRGQIKDLVFRCPRCKNYVEIRGV